MGPSLSRRARVFMTVRKIYFSFPLKYVTLARER
jgi:hypothetical protein